MKIIGCDLHARQQTVAMLDTETGEIVNLTLTHEGDHVREFYSKFPRPVRVGIEATGSMQWFSEPDGRVRESNARSVIQQIYGRPSHGSRNMIGETRI
jgi:hypothetical protein